MNEMDLLTKIEGLEKAIKEHQDFVNTYSNTLTTTKQELVDLHKPELTPSQIDDIHSAVEKAVEGFDFTNNDNYEFEFVLLIRKHIASQHFQRILYHHTPYQTQTHSYRY